MPASPWSCPPNRARFRSRGLGGLVLVGTPGTRLAQSRDVLNPAQLLVQFRHGLAQIGAFVLEPHLHRTDVGEAEGAARQAGAQAVAAQPGGVLQPDEGA